MPYSYRVGSPELILGAYRQYVYKCIDNLINGAIFGLGGMSWQ